MTRISSTDRRSALLSAAQRVIAREGVAAATTRAIVAEADMPLASFHYVFHSRDEMMRDLIGAVIESESLAAIESIAENRNIHESVRLGLDAYFDVFLADPSQEQSIIELLFYALRTPDLADLPPQQYESYRQAAIPLLVRAAQNAGVRWMLPVDDIARLLVTLTDGVTLAWLADRDTAAARRMLAVAADTIAGLSEPITSAPPTSTGKWNR